MKPSHSMTHHTVQPAPILRQLLLAWRADGVTALILAARLGHVDVVDVLTQLGADVNLQDNCECHAMPFIAIAIATANRLLC